MRKIAIVLLALSVGGCAKNITMTEAIGAVGGAAIGGFVGSHFGSGLFQTLFNPPQARLQFSDLLLL